MERIDGANPSENEQQNNVELAPVANRIQKSAAVESHASSLSLAATVGAEGDSAMQAEMVFKGTSRNTDGFSEATSEMMRDTLEAVHEYFKPFFKTIELNALNVINSFNYTDNSTLWGMATRFYLIPEGAFMYFWTRFVIMMAYLNGLLLVYSATFREDNSVSFTLSYAIDLVFLVDMYFKFHIAFLNGGYWIIHPREMALNYMTHYRFKVDVFANFPTDFFILFFLNYDRDQRLLVLALLRLNRWIRTLRMIAWFGKQGRQLHSSYELLLAKFLCYLSTLLHTVACIWYALACPQSSVCRASSWVSVQGIARNETTTTSMYLQSLYWAATTVTTTGYGDIRPDNNLERAFAAFCMLIGTFFFAYASGIITSVIANLDGRRINLQQKVDAMLIYLRDRNVNTHYQRRVVEWYEYQWERNRGIDIQTVFADLPSSFRSDMVFNMNAHVISRAPFLRDCSPPFKRMLSVVMKFTLYTANQYVVHKGDPGFEMYFIVRGRIDTYDEDTMFPVRSYTEGMCYGELPLLLDHRHPHNARATVNTDIYTLSRSDLFGLFSMFPLDHQTIMARVNSNG